MVYVCSYGFLSCLSGYALLYVGESFFPSVTLCPERGRPFTIQARGTSEQNIYIQRATLNGQPYLKNYLDHADIVKGGTLELEMGPEPNREWGSLPKDCPPEVIRR